MVEPYILVVEPKPPGWSAVHAATFQHASAAANYRHRPPYPVVTIDLLAQLAAGGAVLDAGCGPGDLGRALAPRVERVDAVDVSAPMIDSGRAADGGNAPNLRWIEARIEDAPLDPPYSLVVAGDSVHWFDWEVALPRFAESLAESGVLAVVERAWLPAPETKALLEPIYGRHGNHDFAALDPVHELERRALFARDGRHESPPTPWRPTLDELLGYHHSMSGFVVERLEDPATFDAEVAAVVEPLPRVDGGRFELVTRATVTWGRPIEATIRS
jgi:SAM-dependent methyltransferase